MTSILQGKFSVEDKNIDENSMMLVTESICGWNYLDVADKNCLQHWSPTSITSIRYSSVLRVNEPNLALFLNWPVLVHFLSRLVWPNSYLEQLSPKILANKEQNNKTNCRNPNPCRIINWKFCFDLFPDFVQLFIHFLSFSSLYFL